MSAWARVTNESPCAICGKSDWCSVSEAFAICRRHDDGSGRGKVDRGGGAYWVYRRDGVVAGPWTSAPKPFPPAPDTADLHRVYARVIEHLNLAPVDRRGLRARGLCDEQIQLRGFRSLDPARAREAAEIVVAELGRTLCLSTPGFVEGRDGVLKLAGPAGLVVPVRDTRGEITALKIRRRTNEAPRYVYLSSTHAGGPGPGSPVHVPLHEERVSSLVRLTEGELKADVATIKSHVLTIAIAGVGSWRRAVPVLRALGARTCRLALDADVRTNPHVARALHTMAIHLVDEGFAIEVELWDPAWKGIDDCLVAGGLTQILNGEDALAACAAFVAGTIFTSPVGRAG